MGAVPLIGFLPGGKNWKASGSDATFAFAEPTPPDDDAALKQRTQLLEELAAYRDARSSESTASPTEPAAPDVSEASDPDLVSKLERLDALHRSGSLTYEEFHKAKAQLLAEPGKP